MFPLFDEFVPKMRKQFCVSYWQPLKTKLYPCKVAPAATLVGHVNEYPTMHYFGNPRHTQSMIAYMILTEYFWKFQ